MSILNDEEVVLECPKCRKHGLVRLKHSADDEFECVYCHNREVLNDSASEGSNAWMVILALVTTLIVMAPFFVAL
jgi:hypothetical protein